MTEDEVAATLAEYAPERRDCGQYSTAACKITFPLTVDQHGTALPGVAQFGFDRSDRLVILRFETDQFSKVAYLDGWAGYAFGEADEPFDTKPVAGIAVVTTKAWYRDGSKILVSAWESLARGDKDWSAIVITPRAPPSPSPPRANALLDKIRASCARDWPDDYEMQLHCVKKQTEAAKSLSEFRP